MRRKSERVKSSPSVKQPENVTRRTTRRNKKSPEKSITEEESDNTSDQASHSDSDGDEALVSTKRSKRVAKATVEKEKMTRSRRKTVNKKTQGEQEAEEDVPAETTNESDAPNEDVIAQKSAVDDESISTSADSEPAIEQDGKRKDNGSIGIVDNEDVVNREQTSHARASESVHDNDAIEINFMANETIIELNAAEPESSQSHEEEKSVATHGEVDQPNEADTDRDCEVIPEKETEHVVHVSTTSDSLRQDSDVATVTVTDVVLTTNKTNEISEKPDIDTTVDGDGNAATDEDDTRANNGANASADFEPKDEHVKNASGQNNNKSRNSPRSKSNAFKENEAAAKKPILRKRKWLSSKNATPKVQDIAISTDSLKGLISDVKPVPLADVDLDSSPEPDQESDDVKVVSSTSVDYSRRSEERTYDELPTADEALSAKSGVNATRKVSIVPDIDEPRPPSPAKHSPCDILFITNLVRPFTVLQLKGLLQRTGKIVENGFWMDKIKSKCFVKYETEDEAVETRHALHGIQWPASNPKCLNVDFGTEHLMAKAIALTAAESRPLISSRDDRIGSSGDFYDNERDRPITTEKPVREWDVGKKHDIQRSREQERSEKDKEHGRERDATRESERDRDRNDRRRRVSPEKRKASTSPSPSRKYSKKENEPPLRLLDDLFRKTKTTPCIYWLPLTPEQIAVREEERLKQMAEHKRRLEQIKKERAERLQARDAGGSNGDRDRDREKDRERRDRDRGHDRRDSRRRRDSSRSSRDRDRGGRRRY